MKFYSYDEIKASANCLEVAKAIGLNVDSYGRCAATWRGGSNPQSISINEDGFYDFATEESGSVLDLVAREKFGETTLIQAQQWLGEFLGLTHKQETKPFNEKRRYDRLVHCDGYKETNRYDYIDIEGNVVLQVIRLEHPDKKKEFVQYDPINERWTVKDMAPPLYNLPMIMQSSWAIIVEGEKDANRLIAEGYPATTCAGGSKKWRVDYAEVLRDKHVVIMHDNDDAGRAHAHQVASMIFSAVKEIRIVCPSTKPKGDVSDYLDDGGNIDKLMGLISATLPTTDFGDICRSAQIAKAKDANRHDFRNYYITKTTDEGSKKDKLTKNPRSLADMVKDCHDRFLGFPRRVGASLFDHDKDTGRIEMIHDALELESWMEIKSKRFVDFPRIDSRFTTMPMFFKALYQSTTRYDTISYVPDWPRRDNVYYAHPELPEPHPEHKYFNDLLDHFNPATDVDATLLRAFAAAPLYCPHGIPRPLWVIDSNHGQGTGKTTLAEVIAGLYGTIFTATRKEINYDYERVAKRLVTASGRKAKIMLIDNVTGKFESASFAGLITSSGINATAPYGREEEVRPNDLTYCVTANSATFDTDLISRSFFIHLKRGAMKAEWKSELLQYVTEHRLNILSDIIDILKEGGQFDGAMPQTRFPEFEKNVLQPMCGDIESYQAVLSAMSESQDAANSDIDLAKQIIDELSDGIASQKLEPDNDAVFLQSGAVKEWLRDIIRPSNSIQVVRNLAKAGMIPQLHPELSRFPNNGPHRSHGILWAPEGSKYANFKVYPPSRAIKYRKGNFSLVIL